MSKQISAINKTQTVARLHDRERASRQQSAKESAVHSTTYILNAVLGLMLLVAPTALAQTQSPVFLSAKSGNDTNRCTLDAPCLTFKGAMSRVAADGEIIILDSGEYGLLGITKPVSVIAPEGVYAGINAVSDQAVIVDPNVSNAYVMLRGLSIKGTGNGSGVNLGTATVRLRIERCTIKGFTNGIHFEVPGQPLGSQESQLFVTDSSFMLCRNGIFVRNNTSSGYVEATIEHCRLDSNSIGVWAATRSRVTTRNSVASNNSLAGLMADDDGAELNIENCLIAGGNYGIFPTYGLSVPVLVRVSNSTIINNSIGIGYPDCGDPGCPTFTQVLTRGNNTLEGNRSNGLFTGSFTAK